LAEGLFGHGPATETPGVAHEFGGGDFFDGVGGGEGGPEGGGEVFLGFFFFGLDAVIGGEEAEFGEIGAKNKFSLSVTRFSAGGDFGRNSVCPPRLVTFSRGVRPALEGCS
jgi:hypothetical protein